MQRTGHNRAVFDLITVPVATVEAFRLDGVLATPCFMGGAEHNSMSQWGDSFKVLFKPGTPFFLCVFHDQKGTS